MRVISAYASRTGTRSTLKALRDAGWRLLVSAANVHRTEGMRYAIDNGAWSAHTKGIEWDRGAFDRLVGMHGPGADWIVCPDVVADATETIRRWRHWLPLLSPVAPVLVALQDGMTRWDAYDALDRGARGLFLGGSTAWKLATMQEWGRFAAERGCYYHVARVNTARRISAAIAAGAHSFDGSGVSLFPSKLQLLDAARRQLPLFVALGEP